VCAGGSAGKRGGQTVVGSEEASMDEDADTGAGAATTQEEGV